MRGEDARTTSGFSRGRAWDLRRCHARPNSRLVSTARTRQVTVNEIICGVDVSKDWLDAHVQPGGASGRFANDAQGIAELALFCRGHGAGLVAMEASGGCERSPFLLLWQEGLSCALVNARQVRRRHQQNAEDTELMASFDVYGYLQPA